MNLGSCQGRNSRTNMNLVARDSPKPATGGLCFVTSCTPFCHGRFLAVGHRGPSLHEDGSSDRSLQRGGHGSGEGRALASMVRVRAQSEWAANSTIPLSTRWHRAHGRQSMREKATKQQLLTPAEERALVQHVLRLAHNGYLLPAKLLTSLAIVILQKRAGAPNSLQACQTVRRPGRNWPLAFLRRHPELKARRVKAVDWRRHDHNIYEKSKEWFEIIGEELQTPLLSQENIYNMDETGVMLNAPKSLRVLVGKDDLRNYRGAGVQRTLVTAIECVSADGRSLDPLIVWPAATHRNTWTTHATPGWHFACSESGYTNSMINLYWIKNVFEPATRSRANSKPRMLISDGFAAHESIEVMTFCFENNITLCRLPSHTSHKLQPCDVGVFAPLKTAYREQVERLFRGGANMIGKQHFTLLYDRARQFALTCRNIRSGWSKAGLWPFNPERVLATMSRPIDIHTVQLTSPTVQNGHLELDSPLRTPTDPVAFKALRSRAEVHLKTSSNDSKSFFEKLANAAEISMTNCALKDDQIVLLEKQNNEKKVRQAARPTVVGKGKVFSWEDIVAARQKQDRKVVSKQVKLAQKIQASSVESRERKAWRADEIAKAEREILGSGMANFCTVFSVGQFVNV